MKRSFIALSLCLVAVALQSAPLVVVNVSAPAINCVFNTNCVVEVEDTLSPITLPGGIGIGFLQTRTFEGGPGSPAEGLFGYEYRIDLRGITPTNVVPCFTNVIRCFTNVIGRFTNVVNCTTNLGVVTCVTNRVAVTNAFQCFTNLIPCPGTLPCIQALTIPFGTVVTNLDFAMNATLGAQVYVVTNGGLGSNAPTAVTQEDGVVTFHFLDPICPGESSFFIGLVSTRPPGSIPAEVTLTTGSNIVVLARGPSGRPTPTPIPCDFSALQAALEGLQLSDINAPNNNARRAHLRVLQTHLEHAMDGAAAGNAHRALQALEFIVRKADGDRNDWLSGQAAQNILNLIADLVDCLEQFENTD